MITDVWSDLRVIVDRWLRRDFRRLIADAPPIDVVNGDAHQHGDAGSFPTMPKEAGIEEPTRAVSLTYAAEQWFNSTRKALKSELGRTLRVCRIGVNGKKWIFDREQLQERLQGGERYKAIMDDADPATTERTYPRRP